VFEAILKKESLPLRAGIFVFKLFNYLSKGNLSGAILNPLKLKIWLLRGITDF
jgi:hypothetical protein